MAQRFESGQVVPESGLYRVSHEPTHVVAHNEWTLIRGHLFPSCPHCSALSFELLQSHETTQRGRSRQRSWWNIGARSMADRIAALILAGSAVLMVIAVAMLIGLLLVTMLRV